MSNLYNPYNSAEMLCHYGILGMKWGHRKASTMSTEELKTNMGRKKMEQQWDHEPSKNRMEVYRTSAKLVRDTNLALKKSTQSSNKLNLSKMSDAQLRDKINRENLERQYNNMFAEQSMTKTQKGKRYVSKVLDGLETGLTITGSAAALALALRQLA